MVKALSQLKVVRHQELCQLRESAILFKNLMSCSVMNSCDDMVILFFRFKVYT